MTSSYEILATVELLHEYYTDSRCPDFSIVPDAATSALLRGTGMLMKNVGNALILLCKVDEDGAADRMLPANSVLRFQLNLEQPRMLSYTNLEVSQDQVLYFSNRLKTTSGGDLHLNTAIPSYSTSAIYRIGSLVTQTGTVYEAIRPVNDNDHAPGDTDYWQPRAETQYVHSGDLIRRTDGRIRLNIVPAAGFSVATFAFDPQTAAFDQPVGEVETQRFESAMSSISVDRSALPTGRYRVRVNAQDFMLLIDREGSQTRSLGLIELWNIEDKTSAFSLYDNDGKPGGARFLIRFANRLAIWKYRMKTAAATGISIPGQTGAFTAGDAPLEYISTKPMPLHQQAIRNIQLMRGTDILANRLANPPPERISLHTDGGITWYCVEMRLNY